MTSVSSAVLGGFLIYISSSLSSAAGIGGGILNVGIYLVVWGFTYQKSAILSIATLFGNYGAQFFLVNVWLPHRKDVKRPLVYYDVALLMYPCQLGGANIGVILSYIFPETLLLILAMVVLVCSIGFAIDKAVFIYEKENEVMYSLGDTSASRGETQSLLRNDNSEDRSPADAERRPSPVVDDGHNLPPVEGESEIEIPWDSIKIIVAVWLIYAASYIGMELVTECSWDYFLLLVIVYPIIIADVIWCRSWVIESQKPSVHPESETVLPGPRSTLDAIQIDVESTRDTAVVKIDGDSSSLTSKSKDKDDDSHASLTVDAAPIAETAAQSYSASVLEGDIFWDQVSIFPFVAAFCIGAISVLLGIGGGELMGPLLLTMNVSPDVVAATLPFMSFLTQSSSLVHYMTLGDVTYSYAGIVFGIGALGGLTGRSAAVWLYKVFKRASGLVILLIFVLLLSLGMFIYYFVEDLDDIDFTFSSYC